MCGVGDDRDSLANSVACTSMKGAAAPAPQDVPMVSSVFRLSRGGICISYQILDFTGKTRVCCWLLTRTRSRLQSKRKQRGTGTNRQQSE